MDITNEGVLEWFSFPSMGLTIKARHRIEAEMLSKTQYYQLPSYHDYLLEDWQGK